MKSKVKKLLAIFILIISYIFTNLMCGNEVFAISQTTSTDINSIDSNQYPQIKEMLQSIQTEHPNWKFKILYTDINWSDAIANEYVGHGASPRNLVPANNSSYDQEWICKVCGAGQVYDSGKWYCASESAIAYMMDARNSINNSDIFQFLELSYSECNVDSLKTMVANSFLSSDSCVNAILEAARTHNVNAYYIVARLFQEQGRDGSTLSKGQGYNGQYVGYYNVFNIGASGNGKETVILNGLATAQANGWNTIESSIIGGTSVIAKNYIARGQNTLYLQKFDVDNSDGNLYWHQYMQNILAAQKEGETLRDTFADMGSIDGEYTFIIPVFKNMPTTASPRPSTTNTSTNESTNTDLVRVNVTGSLYLRNEPRKDATKIGSIYKDDIVTRLEKATEKVDGTYWDYIMTASGVRGYAARETFDYETTYKLYLVPVDTDNTTEQEPDTETETPSTPETDIVIQNDKIKIDTQTNKTTMVPGATVKDFVDLYGTEVSVKNANGEVLSNDAKLGTGCVINDTYTVIVLGDINGDGEVDTGDTFLLKLVILGQRTLNEECFIDSSDINNDGIIDTGDAFLLKKQILQISNITL